MHCLRLFIVVLQRITLFTTLFTVIIEVSSLQSMCTEFRLDWLLSE